MTQSSSQSTSPAAPATTVPHPIDVPDTVELAVVTRNGVIESRHLGAVAVVGPDGELVAALGNPEASIYPRSTLKPFQALASLRAGAVLDDEELALACASHVGSQRHQDLAAQVLRGVGLSEEDLRCPVAWPKETQAFQQRVRDGLEQNRLAFNCSGKHAGFLAAAVASGWDTEGYLDPEHPLQRLALEAIEEMTGSQAGTVAVDGCGAPVPQIPLVGLARGVSSLMRAAREGTDPHASRIVPAILAHPWAVHGEGEENTVVMERLGVLAKLGAEGVLILGAPDGTALALKVLDGSSRPATLVGLSVLAGLGVLDADEVRSVLDQVVQPVLGGGEPVGAVEVGAAVADLRAGRRPADTDGRA